MRAFVAGWSAALGLLLAAGSSAQSTKLNGALVRSGPSDIAPDFVFTPDGARVLFRADLALDQVFELWVAPSDGSAPATPLSGDLGSDNVVSFALGANGRVVFLAQTSRNDPAVLFSVPLDGGSDPVDLTGPLVDARWQVPFELSADGSRAVFHVVVPTVSSYIELFSVPIDGSAAPVPLDPARPRPTQVSSFWMAPAGGFALQRDEYRPGRLQRLALDGSAPRIELTPAPLVDCDVCIFGATKLSFTRDARRAVFVLTSFSDDDESLDELFHEATDGTGPVVRMGNPNFRIRAFALSPDETRIVWQEDNIVYSGAIDGTGVVRLTPAGRSTRRFELAPDGERVVLDGGTSLYSVPIVGGVPTELAETDTTLLSFAIAPDSSTVVFAGLAAPGHALFAVPIGGGASPLSLSGPVVAGSSGVSSFAIAPDSERVLYGEDRSGHQLFELRSVPLDGSAAPVLVSAPLSGPRDVTSFRIAPQGERAVYLADQANDETFELFGAPASGGAPPARLHDPLPDGPVVGDVLGFRALPRGKGAVYRAQEDALGVVDLYSVLAEGPPQPVRLTEALAERGDVLADLDVSPSGSRVAFLVDDFFTAAARLWVVPTDGSRAPLELASSTAFNPFPAPRLFDPEEERLVFRSARFVFDTFDLMSVRLSGGPAIRLGPLVTGTRSVREFALAAGGDLAVYRADHDLTGVNELYSVPVDGVRAAVKLSPPLAGNRDVAAFLVAPSGLLVVFLADKTVDGRNDLYAAPADGSRAAWRLGDPAATDGVTDFRFAPDGKRLVYRTDRSFDLYSTPFQESGPSLLLTPFPVGWRVEPDFAIARAQVVFRAAPSAVGPAELFRAPLLGDSPPVSISGPLPSGRRVTAFAVTPDGARVVYLANQRDSAIVELYGASLAGGAPVVLDPLPAFADVASFALAPDARSVVYRADREQDGQIELFVAPLDGSAPGRRISGEPVSGGNVAEDFAPLANARALYRADEKADEVVELFLGGALTRAVKPR